MVNGVQDFGLVAIYQKVICQINYFPPTLLDQLSSPHPFYQTQQDSHWTLGAIFCELITRKHPFHYFEAFN